MENIDKAASLYFQQNINEENIIFECSKGKCKYNNKELEISGKTPESGKILIDKSGNITYEDIVLNGFNCYKEHKKFVCDTKKIRKTYNESKIVINSESEYNLFDYNIYGNSVQNEESFYVELPNEYQQLEYIESTGTQYIETNYNPNNNTNVIYDFEYISGRADSYIPILGQRVTMGENLFSFWVNSTSYNVAMNYGQSDTSGISETNGLGRHIYSNIGSKFYLDNNIIASVDNNEFQSNYPISIFGLNTGSLTEIRQLNGRVYSLIIYENDKLVRNFIPCYRKLDNEIGLYDTIQAKFYTNSGTGVFASGPILKPIKTTSVGDYDSSKKQYKIPVKITGKNLFDINSIKTMYNSYKTELYYYFSIKDGVINNKVGVYSAGTYMPCNIKTLSPGTYTLSGEVSDSVNSGFYVGIRANGAFITSTYTSYKNSPNWEKFSYTFTLEEESVINGISLQGNGSASNYLKLEILFRNIQIEEGGTATVYEPLYNETTNIYLEEPLRRYGEKADYIDFKNGKVVRYIEEDSLGNLKVLSVPKEEKIELPEVLLRKGINNIEIDTSIKPSKIELEFNK